MTEQGPRPRNLVETRMALPRGRHMRERMQEEGVIIIPKNAAKSAEAWSLKPLVEHDYRVRFDKKGTLRCISYPQIPPKKQLEIRAGFDLKDDVKIVYEEWKPYPDVETGIRMTRHVKDKHDQENGKVVLDAREVIHLVKDLSVRLQEPGVDREDMQQMAIDAAEVLAKAGYVDARKFEKQRCVEEIMRAADVDSKNRVNTSRSRLILSNAWVTFLTRSLFEFRMVHDKYSSMHATLLRERELERFYLSQAKAHAEYIATLRPGNNEIGSARRVFREFVHDFLSHKTVRLQPYARVADSTRYLVLGKHDAHDYTILEDYLGEKEAQVLFAKKPFDQLTGPELVTRMNLINSQIDEVLELGNRNLLSDKEREAQAV